MLLPIQLNYSYDREGVRPILLPEADPTRRLIPLQYPQKKLTLLLDHRVLFAATVDFPHVSKASQLRRS